MRYIKNILIVLASIFIFASCELNIEKAYLDSEDEFGAPVLNAQADVIVNPDNIKKESVVFNWTGASFGPEVEIEYVLWVKYGVDSARVSSSFSTTMTVPKEDLNGAIINNIKSFPVSVATEISSYLMATVKSTAVTQVKSNVIAYKMTTFNPPLRWYFLPGAYSTWGATDGNKFWETGGGTNVFQTLVDMKVTPPGKSEFKVIAQNGNDWLGADVIKPDWDATQVKDNLFVTTTAESSIFFFTFNISGSNEGTASRVDFDSVNILGTFSDWEKGKDGVTEQKFTYDKTTNIWSSPEIDFITDADGGLEFSIRLGSTNWEHKYGPSGDNSTEVTNGIDLKKEVSGDRVANIKVPSTGKYIMKLHGNRTPFVLVMEKQP